MNKQFVNYSKERKANYNESTRPKTKDFYFSIFYSNSKDTATHKNDVLLHIRKQSNFEERLLLEQKIKMNL